MQLMLHKRRAARRRLSILLRRLPLRLNRRPPLRFIRRPPLRFIRLPPLRRISLPPRRLNRRANRRSFLGKMAPQAL